jgi:Protein of unknown function (DUF559)/Transcriptional regulator, AbiEi antitoxin
VRYLPPAQRDIRNGRAAIARVAAGQHGLITTAQLFAAGLTRSTISRRVQHGELHRVYVGVYAVGHDALSREGVWMAGVLAGGPGALLSHLCAAKHCEVSRFPAPVVDVTVPRQRRSQPGIRFHRAGALHPRDISSHRGIPVTSMHRLLVDLGAVLTPHQEANVIHEAAYRGRFVESATRDAMARAFGHHGLGVLDRAIALHHAGSAGTRSGAEDAFLRIVCDFAEPLVNMEFEGFERDFHWPRCKLVVEVDGPAHGRPRDRLDDARRDRTLREAGYTVLRFTDEDVYQRPRDVLARLAISDIPCRRRAGRAPAPR